MQIGRPFGVQNLGSAKVKQGRVLRRELMYPAAGGGGTEASSAALLRYCSSLLYNEGRTGPVSARSGVTES